MGRGLFFCLFFAFHFSKRLKFVLGLPKWKFSRKMTLPPLKILPVTPLLTCICFTMTNNQYCIHSNKRPGVLR